MAKQIGTKIVTANHLIDGEVIYLGEGGEWVRDLRLALVISDPEEGERLLAEAEARAEIVVGAYLVDVAVQDGRPEPAHFREDFRRTGPSNYLHGKQADIQAHHQGQAHV